MGSLDLWPALKTVLFTSLSGISPLIPPVQRMLVKRFPGRLTPRNESRSIAAGFAIANCLGYRYSRE